MPRCNQNTLLILIVLVIVSSCAKQVSLSGGPVDEEPPKLIKSIPENLEVNYQKNKVYLFFDEFVSFKDFNKEFIMTPRSKNIKVWPSSEYASKKVVVHFEPIPGVNTYKMDFGKTFQDYRESNVLERLTLVFSLNTTPDSGKIKGQVLADTTEIKKDKLIALLYSLGENEQFNEESVIQKKASYVARVDKDSLSFAFDYLPSVGKYKVIVIEDLNNSRLYNFEEHVGFITSTISTNTDLVYKIPLFKSSHTPVFKKFEKSKGKIRLIYDYVDYDDRLKIKPINNVIESYEILKTMDKDKTYLDIWHTTHIEKKIAFKFKDLLDTISIDLKKDTLDVFPKAQFYLSSKEIHPDQELSIESGTVPIKSFNQSHISLIERKSKKKIDASCKMASNNRSININFNRRNGVDYKIQLIPKAIIDYFGNTNSDTLELEFSTLNLLKQTGSLELYLEEGLERPLMIELNSKKNNFKKELKKGKTKILFEYLPKGVYKLVLFIDENSNQLWDTGDFLNQKQPELRYTKEINIKIGEATIVKALGSSTNNLLLELKKKK